MIYATTRTIMVRVPAWDDEVSRGRLEDELRRHGYRVKSANLSRDPEYYEVIAVKEDE